MMERLTCTVIIPTLNRAAFIGEAIDGILAQTRKPDQVIVVNDGSTDGTMAVLEGYGDRIEVISKPNGGKATAINMAIPRVLGDCVWVFDDDDVALPDALERHLSALENDPEAGFTYSAVKIGHSGPDGRMALRHETRLPKVERDEFLIRMMEHCFVQGQPAVVVRTDALKRIGLFDTRLVRCQDYDVMLRLARHFPPARIEEATFIQRRHDGPRGTLSQSHSGTDPFTQWSRHNAIFISELLDDLPLTGYVRQSQRFPQPFDERLARVQRFVIAARHGILEHAERDLAWIVASGDDLTAEERQMLFRSLTHFTALREIGPRTCLRLARLCWGRLGRQIRVAMAKGLIYEMLAPSPAGDRRFSSARILTPRVVALIGVSGAFELLREKLSGKLGGAREAA
ncbi:hypothetical protein N825_27325 [Skermanella stibiiresistens SB22]|uniref:Glycosyltransferase 2-like domain-containing protein n=1 Tax=Skermanella stibiiresistens SB22 TaxID=1385369 RepID=W9HC72_9PROT|nr:glycosyltransferase family A protein [Skermanella stibiiresistens]EWY41483.1 hypothetical protein N825_27325 [Skermanella stibiiresistens SB22]